MTKNPKKQNIFVLMRMGIFRGAKMPKSGFMLMRTMSIPGSCACVWPPAVTVPKWVKSTTLTAHSYSVWRDLSIGVWFDYKWWIFISAVFYLTGLLRWKMTISTRFRSINAPIDRSRQSKNVRSKWYFWPILVWFRSTYVQNTCSLSRAITDKI